MALTIKDGNNVSKTLKTSPDGADLVPHHNVDNTVNVTASDANPVYVTGNISISQPVNVDLVVGDTLTASIANAFFDDAIIGLSHSYYSSVGGASNALGIKFPLNHTATVGSYNALLVQTTGSSNTRITNGYFDDAITALSYSAVSSSLRVLYQDDLVESISNKKVLLVKTTGSSIVTIGNGYFDDAIVAISHSANVDSLRVSYPDIYTVDFGSDKALLVKTTGSSVSIADPNAASAFQHLTDAFTTQGTASFLVQITGSNSYDLGGGHNAVLVKTTGSSTVTVDNTYFDDAIIAISHSATPDSLKIKLTGSNVVNENGYDILYVRGTGSQTEITNTGFDQAISALTGAQNGQSLLNVHLTGSNVVTEGGYDIVMVRGTGSETEITNVGFEQAVNYVTAAVDFSNDVIKFKVKLTGSTTEVTNTSSSALYITSSSPIAVKESSAKITSVNAYAYPAQYDWSSDASGTFALAAEDDNRKGLIVSNPTAYSLYVVLGSGSNNGFDLNTVDAAPTKFSFIIYPSGTYIAEPIFAAAFHAGFFVSQSNFTSEVPYAVSTKVTY